MQCDDENEWAHIDDLPIDEQEKAHFDEVLYSFLNYKNDVRRDLGRWEAAFQQLSPEDLALWPHDPKQWLRDIECCVERNQQFIKMIVECAGDSEMMEGAPQTVPDGHEVKDKNACKVRSTLRQFVRDWAAEGKQERDMCYTPLINALLQYMPVESNMRQGCPPRVLCPGSGLGRLPFECAARRYFSQGNEFSYHMLLGSNFILNVSEHPNSFSICPFVCSTANRNGSKDHLAVIKVPDVCPSQILPGDWPYFSMVAGEFFEVYKDQHQEWDSILTCFFIDTAKNIFQYIRIFADILRPGGLWANLGPLLWHYAEMENQISIELSWEEIKPAILKYFDIKEERQSKAYYTTGNHALMRVEYDCVFFAAVRNNVAPEGYSHPVFPT
eukprot:gnl/MRDRNA2_/MRDRNA2_240115_c0_seq1.p1 gnl/MRDRNA2_/MRDRNA2_240115_c0~~gnl/MRDRNA2_/MRDRNA2_240115_c0_seq1.p1  ORF type:complete len:385 (+),score=66.26 gnl/MRDRNA2_/MRDRNA2_240115_c0_seq1:163-1317(+)